MGRWPFVGRTAELALAVRLLTEGGGALLVGPSGVGKTALAEHALAEAAARGMTVRRVQGTAALQRLPFGALAPLLPADRELPPVQDMAALLRVYASELAHANGGRLALLIDDAHLLDDASTVLLLELARRREVGIVATVRTGAGVPDAIAALWKDEMLTRIDVRGLDVGAIEQVLEDALGGSVDAVTAVLVDERCHGNPLYVRELVTAALEEGTLCNDDGTWRLQKWPEVSDRLVDLVQASLAKLSEQEEQLLELIAFTEPLGPAELEAFGLVGAAEELERRELVTSRTSGRRLELWLAHPMIGDVLRAQLGAFRQRRIAQMRADVLEPTGLRRREDALVVASWRLIGGDSRPELLLSGALSAYRRQDHTLTEQLAVAAVRAGAGFEARFLAAQSASLLGRPDDAEVQFVALADEASTDGERGMVASARVDAALRAGRPARHILDDAERVVSDPWWRDRLLTSRCTVLLITDGYRASLAAAAPLLTRPETEPLPHQLYLVLLHLLIRMGRLDEAQRLLDRARAVPVESAVYGPWEAELLHREIEVRLWRGELADAEALAVDVHRDGALRPDLNMQAYAAMGLAACHLEQGRVATAAGRARESFRLFREYGRLIPAREPGWTATVALALRDPSAARDLLAEVEALPGFSIFDAPRQQLGRAWIIAASGDLRAARDELTEAADAFEVLGDLQHAAAAWHGIARLGYAELAAERLSCLASTMEGPFAAARAAHAIALATRDPEALATVGHGFAVLGANLYAAEAHAEAAVLYRRAGKSREAAAEARRADLLASRCEDARTPALLGLDVRARLTRAEVETAQLAAAGRSNREIAELLTVSLRTVENRLYKIYEKLGVTSRDALADALHDV